MARRAPTPERVCASPGRSSLSVQPVVVLLVGLGISLAACGYVSGFERALDASPATFRWASSVLFFAMALGPRLPRWVARRWLGRGQADRPSGGNLLPVDFSAGHHSLEWTVLAFLGSTAGIAVLLLPALLRGAQGVYLWALGAFLWNSHTLGVLDVLIMVAAVPPFIILGMLIQCVHRLGVDRCRWQPQATVVLLSGVGLGLGVAAFLQRYPDGDVLVLRVAGVPLLVAGMLAVWRSGALPRVRRTRRAASALVEPESGNHWPVVLRLALAITTAAGTSAVLVWVYVVDALDMATGAWRPACAGALVISASVGLGWALRPGGRSHPHALGAFGMRCALAGGAMAAGMALFNLVARASYPAFLHTPAAWVLWAFGACVPVGVLAWALGGGIHVFISRSSDDPATGAALIQILLGSAGAACLVVAFPLLEGVGSYPTLVAMALALVAMGGTLVIHDPYAGQKAHRARLAGVFGGVVVMTFLMPEAGRRWLGHQQRVRGRMWESWWVTQDLARAEHTQAERAAETILAGGDGLIDWYRVRAGCRVGVVSLLGDMHLELPARFSGRVDQWGVLAAAGGEGAESNDALAEAAPALQALRATRNAYDVLIVALEDAPPEFACRLLAEGLLERTWARLAHDATLICVLPGGEATVAAVHDALAAPELAGAGAGARFATVRVAGGTCLTVRLDRGAGQHDDLAWAEPVARQAEDDTVIANGR
ncbi:MAG TPA: hypothetical protein P5572_00700 [Phycisphaerae bacterium]|nr:hypothetical protein [Phycisphaerales bacterium]HRX83517.1 hypothetical protein [Phycisphaerae bacterium]